MPDPERALSPCEARIAAAAGCWNRTEHTTGLRVDLLDAVFGNLKQVLAVERCPRVGRDIDRSQSGPARRIEGGELVSGGKPDMLTVVGHTRHVIDIRKRPIFTDDLGALSG